MLLNRILSWLYFLFRAEIFYPSMKALAQQMGKERDYEILVSGSQSLVPPPGASDIDVKAWQVETQKDVDLGTIMSLHLITQLKMSLSQLHTLLESTECDMIREVQRRITGELTLVVSERARQNTRLPTGK